LRPTPAPAPWADELFTIGVTGTNGKTSTTHLIASAIAVRRPPVLTVGTIGYFLGAERLQVERTAQGFFDAAHRAHDEGARYAAVECTSRALANGYAKRWRFDLGVFTNLSDEHLDLHGSWEHYLAAKAQLFVHLGGDRVAVLNAADEASLALDHVIPQDVRRLWYGSATRRALVRPADLEALRVEVDPSGTHIALRPSEWADRWGGSLATRMVGSVFAENTMAAALAATSAGIDAEGVALGLAHCPGVPGRFEILGRRPLVAVDYAHTPDALAHTLATARRVATGRLAIVFGAGGDRCSSKRHAMGEVAGHLADLVVLTNDNPRHESPQQIIAMLAAGVRAGGRASLWTELDRGLAIERALSWAHSPDVVVVAGKGHETGQTMGDEVRPFSDRDEIMRLQTRTPCDT